MSEMNNEVRPGDLVVHQGFSDELAYGQWGLVASITGEHASIRFTRSHSPVPIHAGSGTVRLVTILPGVVKDVPMEKMKQVGILPGDQHPVSKWYWYGEAIDPEAESNLQDAWLQHLRNRSYPMTRECLHDAKGYSVMGVACDIIGKKYAIPWRRRDDLFGVLGNYTTTPRAFLNILRLTQNDADFLERLSDSGRIDDAINWLSIHYRRHWKKAA